MTSPSDTSPQISSVSINLEFLPDWAKQQTPIHHKNFEESEAPKRAPKGKGRRPGGPGPRHGKNDRRDRKPQPHRRPDPIPSELANIQVHFTPESKALESVIEQIRITGRTYPLFSLAKMFLDKPERHGVMFRTKSTEKGKPAQPLYQCLLCTAVALGESEAVTHVLTKHRSQYYEEEKVTGEPVKGNFTSVARCDLNGALLGPSNYHGYQANIMALYKKQFVHMSFDRFKQSISSVRDPELVKKWLEQSAQKSTFKCLQVEQPTVLQSPAEMEKHFRENYFEKTIRKSSEIPMTGEASRGLEDHRVTQIIRTHWEKEDQFPANLANRLRQSFTKVGLHVFKARRGIQFVSQFRPQALVANPIDISPNVGKILDFIKANPSCDRKKLFEALEQKDASAPSPEASAPTSEASPLLKDLHWLIHQGHVIEYHNGHLEAVRPPLPKPAVPAKAGEAIATVAEEGVVESVEDASESTETPPESSEESSPSA